MTDSEPNLRLRSYGLVVIDMQNDFIHEKGVYPRSLQGYDPEQYRKIVARIKTLIDVARKLGIPLIYTKSAHRGLVDFSKRALEKVPLLRQEGFRKGQWGCEIIEELEPSPKDYVVEKTRYDAFYNTDLEVLLRGLDLQTLIFTGIMTEICVESTIRSAVVRDFDVIVVSDCTAGRDQTSKEASLKTLESMMMAFVKVASLEEVIHLITPCAKSG